MLHHNVWYEAKVFFEGKFIPLSALKKKKKKEINYINSHLKKWLKKTLRKVKRRKW